MKKAIYKFIVLIIISNLSAFTLSEINVQAKEKYKLDSTSEESLEHIVEPLTEEEQKRLQEKISIAEQYVKNKKNKKRVKRSYNQQRTLNYNSSKFQVQNLPFWCGPGAAYNAIVSKKQYGNPNQQTLAWNLKTTQGTSLGTRWIETMNKYLPGNNYQISRGEDFSDWFSKFKNSIIYTIDKGYPIIIDTYQPVGQARNQYISDIYRNIINNRNNRMYHYAAIIGYDDTPGNDRVLIVDSYKNVPRVYWTYTKWVANTTKGMGIVW